jgi:hypothetical protein
MTNREEEGARCQVPRPGYMKEIEPGPLDRFCQEGVPERPDPEVMAHNRKLMERNWRSEPRKKAG